MRYFRMNAVLHTVVVAINRIQYADTVASLDSEMGVFGGKLNVSKIWRQSAFRGV